MNSQNFFKNLETAHESLKEYNLLDEEKLKVSIDIALKLEELDLKNRQMALQEEETRQKLELTYLEYKNKLNHTAGEILKSLIQSHTMLKSVWDNANINKANALVGLFNSVMNAQNVSNLKSWETFFTEIKNAVFAIGADSDSKNNTNDLLKTYTPLLNDLLNGLSELGFENKNIKQVSILAPKLELIKGESMVIRAICGFQSDDYGFEFEGNVYKSFSFLFEARDEGTFILSFFALNDKEERIKDEIQIKVLSEKRNLLK
ncbi:hypothetical protein [uncultured Campylobacter sp.]|uniref:hypothetical protein n=1 Tax=uncultured Campylobacter sp. TaxID=218934 RepID=UPI0026250DAD|nr:hypothetical protein [uncultured Campylobacter sp.]